MLLHMRNKQVSFKTYWGNGKSSIKRRIFSQCKRRLTWCLHHSKIIFFRLHYFHFKHFSHSILGVRKKNASVHLLDLTVRKKEHPFSRSTWTVRKKISSVWPCRSKKNYIRPAVQLNPSKKFCIHSAVQTIRFRTACPAISYPFAWCVFSRSNGYRKERFRVERSHFSP